MKHFKKLAVLVIMFGFLVIGGPVFSQDGGGGDDDEWLPPTDCDPLDPTCPIDGGLVALLAVGVGYGVKKVRDANK